MNILGTLGIHFSFDATEVDEGRKSLNLLAIKMRGTNRSGDGGGEPAMSINSTLYVTPDLSYEYYIIGERKEGRR